VGKTVIIKKDHENELSIRKNNNKMFKLKRKKSGVRIFQCKVFLIRENYFLWERKSKTIGEKNRTPFNFIHPCQTYRKTLLWMYKDASKRRRPLTWRNGVE